MDPEKLLDATIKKLAGEKRDGQRELALAVADAMREGHHLVAEAPTGSGKSLAYLAPAVALGLRVVVATSTKALQNQLVDKDLPALAKNGSVKFKFGMLKGRANYLCRAKLRAAAQPDALFEVPVGANFSSQLTALDKFAASSETGDRGELEAGVADAAWAAVSCTSTECPGRAHCDDGESCFAEQARERAQTLDVLVVNHALYCADLVAFGNVLPPHDLVIVDEAHAFADNATSAFGADFSFESITRVSGMLAKAGVDATLVDAVAESGKELGRLIEKRDDRIDIAADEPLATALHAAAERLAAANAKLGKPQDDAARRTAQVANGRLEVLRRFGAPGPDDVVWIERGRSSRRMRIAPVSVGSALGPLLLDTRPVIAVSATLGGEPPFGAFARQVGFDPDAKPGTWGVRGEDGHSETGRGYVSLLAPSSFDWRDQGLLYVGNDLPDPRRANEAWIKKSGVRLCNLVNAAGGRALVLCTSRANVDRFATLLRAETKHDVLAQGDADVGQLTRSFIEDETSVLVGTRSFWAGIDAPGVSCLLVVIDRIPFPPLSDPLHAARQERAEAAGMNAFATVDLPAAALVLAQGVGRLIRRRTDRGVVAVLDARLATQSYRRELLAAMPPMKRSIDVDEAIAFLKDATKRVPASKPSTAPAPDLAGVRNAVACPECEAAIGERCHDESGYTMAFLHDERIALGDLNIA